MTAQPTTLTLSAFLSDRLDDDEAVARAATAGVWRSGDRYATGPSPSLEFVLAGPFNVLGFVAETGTLDHSRAVSNAAHIARHDPARVLADVEAKRRIVALWPDTFGQWSAEQADAARSVKDAALRLLALPYAGHSDYDEAWRP